MLDFAQLRPVLPDSVWDELLEVVIKYKINSPSRMAHFIAQCAHESGNFQDTEENLNYSREALLRVFAKYFRNCPNIEPYVHNPVLIANRVYANRMGNGDEESGDGWRYKGRGYIQLTGKENYRAFDIAVSDNIMSIPQLVATRYPLLSAAWFWNDRKLNDIADQGITEDQVADITKKVNGGYHGLESRSNYFDKFYQCLIN